MAILISAAAMRTSAGTCISWGRGLFWKRNKYAGSTKRKKEENTGGGGAHDPAGTDSASVCQNYQGGSDGKLAVYQWGDYRDFISG